MKKRLFYYLIATCFTLSGCVTIRQPIVTGISNFKFSQLSKETSLKFDVLLKNPNNFGLTLQKMQMEVFFNDSSVSVIGLDKKMHVGANAEVEIPFTVQPKITLLPQLALSGISQLFKKDSKSYKLKGELVVRKFIFRKKYSFKYPE